MSDTEHEPYAAGSVPHHWGNALARRWAPELPRPLTQGFLTCLYALRQLASADGQLRYARDGKGVTLAEIASACRSSQKDVRAFLTAAIAAGVVTTVGTRRRGVAAVYALLVAPRPNWAAAAAVVDNHRRGKTAQSPDHSGRDATAASSDHSGPRSEAASSDHSGPDSRVESSDHSGPAEFGPLWSAKFGPQWSHHPGSTHELPHEDLSVGPQVRDAPGRESHERAEDVVQPVRPPSLRAVDATPGRPAAPAPYGQPPLLLAVPGQPDGPTAAVDLGERERQHGAHRAQAPAQQPEHASPATRPPHAPHAPVSAPVGRVGGPAGADGWRALVVRERPQAAADAYRHRWTGDHARHLHPDTA